MGLSGRQLKESEQALHQRVVTPDQIRIMEIFRPLDEVGSGEIQLANGNGDLIALRKYEPGSPLEKVVELLAQLLASSAYESGDER